MQGVNCVKGEIHNVLTSLRLTARARRSSYYLSHSTDEDEPLLRGLKDLHEALGHVVSLSDVDTCALLDPFLEVVESEHTDADVTRTALESLHKFLVYQHINLSSPHVEEAMSDIVHCMTHRKFEARQWEDSEIVFMKTLEVLLECLRSPAGPVLTDDDVCSMIEECYKVRSRPGTSQLLRRYAENVASQMVLVAFSRISSCDLDDEHSARASSSSSRMARPEPNALQSIASPRTPPASSPTNNDDAKADAQARDRWQRQGSNILLSARDVHSPVFFQLGASSPNSQSPSPLIIPQSPSWSSPPSPSPDNSPMTEFSLVTGPQSQFHGPMRIRERRNRRSKRVTHPYGLPALVRIFSFLANTINPKQSITNRILGLRLLRIVFETTGEAIGSHPRLVQIIQDDLCKHLLRNTQTTDLSVLSLALRIVFDLFNTVKEHLKVHLEVFFSSIHLRIGESESSTFEQKELVLESLVEFCKEPSLIVGLYLNYDCELGSAGLFEDLAKFLSAGASSAAQDEHQLSVLSLEGLVGVLNSIAMRFCTDFPSADMDSVADDSKDNEVGSAGPSILRNRERKKRLQLAASHFNRSGRKSFKFLQGLKVLSDPLTPQSVVKFLRETPNLDKAKIGEILGSAKPEYKAILNAYVDSFDFQAMKSILRASWKTSPSPSHSDNNSLPEPEDPAKDSSPSPDVIRIDEALRVFLESFRLPGEAQQIERIMEAFASRFFKHCPGPLKNEDAAVVMAFSVIMLNTDLHNPGVKKRMTLEDYKRNTRGINDGENVPPEYLTAVYESIKANQIRTTDKGAAAGLEADEAVSDMNWNSLVHRSQTTGPFQTHAPRIHGKEMFSLVWESALHVFRSMLQSAAAASSSTLQDDPHVDEHNAKVLFKVTEGFHTFSRICAFYDLHAIFNKCIICLCTVLSRSLEEADTSDHPAASFGQNYGAQRVALLLFNLVKAYGDAHIQEAWRNVLHIVLWFRKLGLLPANLLEMEDFSDAQGRPLPSVRRPASPERKTTGGSIFSSAFSLLWADDEEHTVDEDNSLIEQLDELHSKPQQGTRLAPLTSSGSVAADDISTLAGHSNSKKVAVAQAKYVVQQCGIEELFAATKVFRPTPLQHIVRSLVIVSTMSTKGGSSLSVELSESALLDEEAAVFCLERLCDVVEKNQHRIASSKSDAGIWSIVEHHFETVLENAPEAPTFYTERVVVNLLRFAIRLVPSAVLISRLLKLLALLPKLSRQTLARMGDRIGAGIVLFLQTRGDEINQGWPAIFSLLNSLSAIHGTSRAAFEAVRHIAENSLNESSFPHCVNALVQFAKPQQPGQWPAVSASVVVDSLGKLHAALAKLSPSMTPPLVTSSSSSSSSSSSDANQEQSSGASAWRNARVRSAQKRKGELWLISLQAFCKLAADRRPELRQKALSALQHALLTSGVHMESPTSWKLCFENLLLPLLSLYIQMASAAPTDDASAQLMKAVQIIFSTLLHNLNTIAAIPSFHLFWLKLLGCLNPLLSGQLATARQTGPPGTSSTGAPPSPASAAALSGLSALLKDHVTENLKNALLVIRTTNVFKGISKHTGQDMWALTWAVLERSAGHLRAELDSSSTSVASSQHSPIAAPSQQSSSGAHQYAPARNSNGTSDVEPSAAPGPKVGPAKTAQVDAPQQANSVSSNNKLVQACGGAELVESRASPWGFAAMKSDGTLVGFYRAADNASLQFVPLDAVTNAPAHHEWETKGHLHRVGNFGSLAALRGALMP